VLTWLPGEPLSAVSNALDDSMAFSVYQQMGSFLARLHRIGQDAFGYVTTEIADPKPTNTEYMTAQFATKLREFRQLGGEPALAAAIDRHVAERTALFADCEHAVLCHNDFHEGNILVRRDDQGDWQICGVIDVENAIAADPLTDLAKTDRYSIRGHRAKLDGLLAGLPPAWCGSRRAHGLVRALPRAGTLGLVRVHPPN
jgi:hygromycin-B 7''-O-kinase